VTTRTSKKKSKNYLIPLLPGFAIYHPVTHPQRLVNIERIGSREVSSGEGEEGALGGPEGCTAGASTTVGGRGLDGRGVSAGGTEHGTCLTSDFSNRATRSLYLMKFPYLACHPFP
jgi:hypothetical protein